MFVHFLELSKCVTLESLSSDDTVMSLGRAKTERMQRGIICGPENSYRDRSFSSLYFKISKRTQLRNR